MGRSFLTGIVSKDLQGQVGSDFYQTACEDANGFLVTPTGSLAMVPGTVYVANTKSNVKVRLGRFIFSEDDVYILEIGPLYIRFYRDSGQLAVASVPVEVATTYTASEIFELDISLQLADTLYIYHSAHQRAKLVREGNTTWTLSDLAMTDGPFRDENTTTTTLTASALTGAGITVTASAATFDVSDHVGAIWQMSHDVTMATETATFSGVANSNSVFVQRNNAWNIVAIPSAKFNGSIDVQFSDDDVTFTTEMNVTQGTSTERQARNGIATDASIYVRLRCSSFTAGTVQFWIYADAYKHNGVVSITAVASTTSATATVLTDLISTDATTAHAEGSWSPFRGYPGSAFFYNQRLGAAGNTAEPQELWLSETNDLESHFPGTLATSAFHHVLDGAMPSPIRWVRVEGKGLLVGTLGQVLSYSPQDITISANPSNPFKRASAVNHPSGFVAPVEAGSSFLMPELGGNALMELLFSSEEESLLAPDLTRFVKDLVRVTDGNGIVSMAFQKRPFPILWCVRSDGSLLIFLYDRPSSTAAWTYATLSGSYESVEVVPLGTYDQVWLSSLHTVGGSSVRFVGYMDKLDIHKPLKDMHFVEAGLHWKGGTANITAITRASTGVITLDAWPADTDGDMVDGDNIYINGVAGMTEINGKVYEVTAANSTAKTLSLKDVTGTVTINTSGWSAYTSGGTLSQVENTFGGMGHLAGESGWAITDGNSAQEVTIAASTVLDDYYNSVSIGRYTTRRIVPMALEGPKSLGRNKHLQGVLIGAHRAVGGRYGPMGKDGALDASKRRQFDWSKNQDPQDWDTVGHTGIIEIMDSWQGKRTRIVIEQPEPLNLTLTMAEPNIEVD